MVYDNWCALPGRLVATWTFPGTMSSHPRLQIAHAFPLPILLFLSLSATLAVEERVVQTELLRL